MDVRILPPDMTPQDFQEFKEKNIYLGTKAAAQFLGISIYQLKKYHKKGWVRVSHEPMNGYRCFKIEDLEELISFLDANHVKEKNY
jgi:hypothetical protein